MASYYTGKSTSNTKKYMKNIKAIHNYLKEDLYRKYTVPNKTRLLELSGGRGGDLYKYEKYGIRNIVFTDIDSVSIQYVKNNHPKQLNMRFIIADGATNFTSKIKKQLFNDGDLFTSVSCQFAMHYFYKSKKTFENFFKNVDTYLQSGGYFFATAFDGNVVNNLLNQHNNVIEMKVDVDNKLMLSIERTNGCNDGKLKPFGCEIDVFFYSIGKHKEYLIDFNYVEKYFKSNGYKLIDTKMFHEVVPELEKKYNKKLNDTERFWSYLSRYVVFQKL